MTPTGLNTLVEDEDYTLLYTNNVNKGQATIYITFNNNYSGTVTYNFEITEINISSVTCAEISDIVFDGTEHKIVPTLTYNSNVLTDDDYTCEYQRSGVVTEDWTKVGTIDIVIRGTGNFTGNFTVSYNITQKDLGDSNVVITIVSSTIIYTGSQIQPEIQVDFNGMTLVEGVDYNITYGDNINVSTGGTITIEAVSNGN